MICHTEHGGGPSWCSPTPCPPSSTLGPRRPCTQRVCFVTLPSGARLTERGESPLKAERGPAGGSLCLRDRTSQASWTDQAPLLGTWKQPGPVAENVRRKFQKKTM